MSEKPVVLVSMCLLGVACRYDGGAKGVDLSALTKRCALLPACPEQLGGLPTPRMPSERQGDRVVARDGRDVTEAFRRGAEQALLLAEAFGARYALLKARSPSCGSGTIYDGSFTGARIPGEGVAAELLARRGIRIFDEEHIDQLIKALDGELE